MVEPPDRAKEFFISGGETTEGPFDVTTLRARMASGQINSRYQVWNETTKSWSPLSTLEPLLRPSETAPSARKGPVRSPRASMSTEGGPLRPPAPPDAEPPAFPGESLKTPAPRHTPNQRPSNSQSFLLEAPAPLEDDDDDNDDDEEEGPLLKPIYGPALGSRQRNYSPISAGSKAARPFHPASAGPAPAQSEAAPVPPAVVAPKPFAPATEMAPAARTRAWGFSMAVCLLLFALILVALTLGGWISFGRFRREETNRLNSELKHADRKLAQQATALRSLTADKQDYLDRFSAAQVAVRNLRVSVLASARRALESGDRVAADQRLFELERLNNLVPENDYESGIHRELTDAYFSSSLKPSGEASPAAPKSR